MPERTSSGSSAGVAPAREPKRVGAPGISILAKPGMEAAMEQRLGAAPAAGLFDRPTTFRGSTPHFGVYYETGFANGPVICDGVLASCENEFNYLLNAFNGLVPPQLPMNIIVAPGIGGAYHYGCSAVDMYCDGDTSATPDIDHTRMLVVAEEVEVMEAASGLGWNCAASPGEGLSRIFATELYPAQLDGFASGASWLDTPNRPDFVTNSDPTDRNYTSIGCSTLFLNYLHYQLDYDWKDIVQASGATLEQTYQNLTGQNNGIVPFKNLLQQFFPVGQPSGLLTDNPFPLLGSINFPICGVQFRASIPANNSQLWFTYGWPVLWDVIWNVIPTSPSHGGPQIGWNVQVEKGGGGNLTYWLTINNPTAFPVDIEARYTIICQ